MESSNNNGDFQYQQPAEGSQNQPSQTNYNYQTQGFQPNYQGGYQGGYNNYQQGGYQSGYQSNYNNTYNSNYQGEYQGGYQGGYNNNYHNNYNNNSYNNTYNNYQGDYNQGGYRRGGNNRYNKYSNTFQPSVFSLPDLPISGKSTPNTATTNSSTTSLSSLASALKEVEETPITEFINKAKEAKTISEIRTAAGELAELLFKEGADKIEKYNLVSQITTLSKSKKSALAREGALLILSTVSRKFGINSPAEAYLLSAFTLPLDLLSDKDKSVARAANTCTDTLLTSYPMDAQTGVLLSVFFKYIEGSAKWQGKVGAIKLVERIVEEVPAESLELTFIEAIPALTFAMNDMKAEVSKAGTKALANFAQKLDNQDVVPRVDIIVKTLADPTKVPDCIKTFSHVTFVAEVTESALAVLVPILWRALNQAASSQDLLRQTVIVVENLTRLVHNPVEVKAFIPELLPGIKRVVETASQPEVRELASKAAKVLEDAEKEDPANKSRVLSTEVADKFPENVDTTLSEYASKVLAADINNRDWNLLSENFKVYFGEKATNEYNEETVKYFRSLFRDSKINDDKEEGIQIVNAEFSLAYGGRMLLNKTFLRLYKGRRYGLCGRNGAGKSTLMRSIASGKLEGFPDKSELKTCFVEHKIQGSEADLDLVSFIASDPELASVGKEEVAKALAEVGFDEDRRSQNVGALSGGWKMKLELARAMLMKADILLLDEPTNHLDVTNVKWLEDYLVSHTEITSLIVSHDSGFLDAVCTDIIHYETKKLVYYKGNLSEFVKVRPEGKAYYTLTDSNVKMAFPPPGILTGVRSNTRAIARMTDVTFTYPGAAKPSLKHVTCSLSLSSRVAILGPNGAGKSTLIKLLTGELIPSDGIVEKHPNLRIGYIAQHALQHVEQHKEKTPNQYLQWRYANGDDREVHLKQTRKMSDEEREQMEKPIAYDGKSPRQVEAIIGRSKLKKSFQYEIKWKGWLPKFNSFIPREELIELGFAKAVQQFDDHEASREGLGYRDLSPPVIRQHFEDVGLDGDIADHTPLGSLSGGQLVKVVIAGAMWNNPHLLVLDEPTNYLDRDSLGGLAVAIREWTGGVVMISHNEEFVGALCPEQWIVDNGEVVQKGKTEVASDRFEDGSLAAAVAKAKDNDSPANIKIRKKKKKLTRNEMKERESRRRLRYIEWLNSPKGTPRPPDTDDEAD